MTEETFNGTWLEATTRRTFYLHMIDMPPVELQGLISLRYLISRINQLEASTPPPQALPLQSGIPEWGQSGAPFRTKFASIPQAKYNWSQGNTGDGKNKKILPS